MDEKTVRQLLVVRYYLSQALGQFRIDLEAPRFAAVNLLHEAMESTLIASADHLNASVSERATIDQYINKVEEKLSGITLPFRSRVMQFNRARVSAKHALTLSDNESLKSFFQTIPEFIKETVRIVFDAELDTVSLVDLIENDEVRGFLVDATELSKKGKAFDGLISVRKALYVLFESQYDVSVFLGTRDGERYGLLDPRSRCSSPYYARSNRYVVENVKTPSDYIVLDHQRIEGDLLKQGIDTHTFWNIWRLTPKLWKTPVGDWIVQYDLDLANNPSIDSDLNYVIDQMIGIALQLQARRNLHRNRYYGKFWSIGIRPEAPIYQKAAIDSPVVGTAPPGVDKLNITTAIEGFSSGEWFWATSYIQKGGPFLGGYLRFADTIGEPVETDNPFDFIGLRPASDKESGVTK